MTAILLPSTAIVEVERSLQDAILDTSKVMPLVILPTYPRTLATVP